MSIVVSILIFNFIGFIGAWQPDIDFNRVRLVVPREEAPLKHSIVNSHKRRSIFSNKHNDHDNHSSRITKLHPSLQFIPDAARTEDKKTVISVHKPREDPKQFYQSDAYLKKINGDNINNEVSKIYPGTDVVRAGKFYYRFSQPFSARLSERDVNNYIPKESVCVKCPHDRTLIVKPGLDRVILQYPNLKSCSGYKSPRDVKFVTKYGPRFGSLLGEGFYGIVGYLTYRNEILQYCNMNVRVLTQTRTCPVPKYLIADCEDQNNTCTFTCRDSKTILHGHQSLRCGEDMKWIGRLPLCKVRTWCESLSPPSRGTISCKGSTINGWGLTEGSICRVRCTRGWKPTPRSLAVCRKGAWTYNITCVPNNYSNIQRH